MATRRQVRRVRLGWQGWFWALALASAVASAQMTTPIRLPKLAEPLSANMAAAPSAAPEPSTDSTAAALGATSKPSAAPEPSASAAVEASSSTAAKPSAEPEPSSNSVSGTSASGVSAGVRSVTVSDVGIEVLQVLSKYGLAPELSEAEQDEFVRRLLALTGTRAILEDMLPAVISPGEGSVGGCEKSLIGPENDFVLLRVWQVDAACVEQLRQQKQELRQAKSKGIVLSLLGSSGADSAAADAFAAVVQEMALPVVVLVDYMTNGGAEVLAGQLRQNGALLIGEKTHGLPGPTQVVTLLGGHRLLVPAAATAEKTAPMLQPDLLLSKDETSGPHDIPPSWLAQAMDFLAAVNALE